jgi:hypothetical protein
MIKNDIYKVNKKISFLNFSPSNAVRMPNLKSLKMILTRLKMMSNHF